MSCTFFNFFTPKFALNKGISSIPKMENEVGL